MNLARYGLFAAPCVAFLAPAVGRADHHDEHARGHKHYDVRHGHNHDYPQRGLTVAVMPHGAQAVVWAGDRYWFHDGVWYRPHAHGFTASSSSPRRSA